MSTPGDTGAINGGRSVDAVCDQYAEDLAALDPIGATHAGMVGRDHELTDLSPSGWDAREELTSRALREAELATPASRREEVARQAFLERLGVEAELAGAGHLRAELNVVTSALHRLRLAFDLMPQDSESAWVAIDSRLAGVPAALAGYRATLLDEAGKGRAAAARQHHEVAAQIRQWTGRAGSAGNVFEALAASAEVAPTLEGQLARHAADASGAFAEFGRFLVEELAPLAPAKDAVGREHYALASRRFLGTTVDLDDIYAWGWDELGRLSGELSCSTPIRRARSAGSGPFATGCRT